MIQITTRLAVARNACISSFWHWVQRNFTLLLCAMKRLGKEINISIFREKRQISSTEAIAEPWISRLFDAVRSLRNQPSPDEFFAPLSDAAVVEEISELAISEKSALRFSKKLQNSSQLRVPLAAKEFLQIDFLSGSQVRAFTK